MKKPVVPRIAGFLLLYMGLFVFIVMIQFSKQRGFTYQVGNLVVYGRYREPEEGEIAPPPPEYLLSGEVSILYGGMEFFLSGEGGGFTVVWDTGERQRLEPDTMFIAGESVLFRFFEGMELFFTSFDRGGIRELRINAALSPGIAAVELPYKPLPAARIRSEGNGRFVISSEGFQYAFVDPSNGVVLHPERRILVLSAAYPFISYQAILDRRSSPLTDFVIPEVRNLAVYQEAVDHWREAAFSRWGETAVDSSDEELVTAYLGESIRQGRYKAAVGAIPNAYKNTYQSYVSSVYLGQLDRGLRSLSAGERDTAARLSQLMALPSAPEELLRESHIIEYLAIRGTGTMLEQGVEQIRSINPAELSLDLAPGIIEGYIDWRRRRLPAHNPFEALLESALSQVVQGIRWIQDDHRVLVFDGDRGFSDYNLRLGLALETYGEERRDEEWTALGRSLVWSVLSLTDDDGMTPAFVWTDDGEDEPPPEISASRLYHILVRGPYSPRVINLESGGAGLWAWTAASAVAAQWDTNGMTLDITVSFLPDETHYMLIRGLRPFTKIQLYGIDFRTAPDFERYDSSGWAYSASEQTLLLKMKHRYSEELVRIFYGGAAAVSSVSATAEGNQAEGENLENL